MASSAVAIVVLATLFGLLRQWAAFDTEGGWGDWELTKQFVLLQVIPALLAGVIGMSVWSPLGESERTAAFPMAWLRLAQVLTLTLLALSVSVPLLDSWESRAPGVVVGWVLIRNLASMVGVALLVGSVFDARWSWTGPIMCVAAVIVHRVFRVPPAALWQGDWLAAGQEDVRSWLVSGVLVLVGMGLFVWHGARDVAGEVE